MMRSRYILVALICIVLLIASQGVVAQTKRPKSVRDYFMLLPQKYFAVESCNTDIEKDCRPFKIEYLKRFLKVEDKANGYLEGDGDGSQEKLKMTLFDRPNGTSVIGLYVFGEWGEKYCFLEYKNRHWLNVSKSVVPKYRRSNVYELPRYGTIIKVYARKNFDPENDFGVVGRQLYELKWKNGKFIIRKSTTKAKS